MGALLLPVSSRVPPFLLWKCWACLLAPFLGLSNRVFVSKFGSGIGLGSRVCEPSSAQGEGGVLGWGWRGWGSQPSWGSAAQAGSGSCVAGKTLALCVLGHRRAALQLFLRAGSVPCRLGGEEACLCPHCPEGWTPLLPVPGSFVISGGCVCAQLLSHV